MPWERGMGWSESQSGGAALRLVLNLVIPRSLLRGC